VSTVSRTISYRLTAGAHAGHTGTVDLRYDVARPFNVDLNFGADDPSWVIWRDVLARRVDSKAEVIQHDSMYEGGVSCEVSGNWAHLTLAGTDDTVTLQLLAAGLDAFLPETERLVPYGSEYIDIDGALAELFGGAR
jgi:hypothetical protein